MSKNKSCNSIFFLTTLSVYLGLVLVGASPSVLAQQAALTQRFEIQNEIESEDDLDKNDEEIKRLLEYGNLYSVANYPEKIENFLKDLGKLNQIGKFDFNEFSGFSEKFTGCVNACPGVTTIFDYGDIDNWLVPAVGDLNSQLDGYAWLGDCVESDQSDVAEVRNNKFEIKFDGNTLEIKFSFSKKNQEKASDFSNKLNSVFIYNSQLIAEEDSSLKKTVLENTIINYENNQVFIITRLPRGSLDSLVKSEKQVY